MANKGIAVSHGAYIDGKEHPMHQRWRAMILRCHDPKNQSFKSYGARGIVVCERWRDRKTGYTSFVSDLGDRPSPEHSLDRVDNDGPYSPENCRWATRVEQSLNRRTCRMVLVGGSEMPAMEAAKLAGMTHAALTQRLNHGWTAEEAVTRPVDKRSPFKDYQIEARGEVLTTGQAARKYNLSPSLLRKRINLGMTGERLIAPSARPYRFKPS